MAKTRGEKKSDVRMNPSDVSRPAGEKPSKHSHQKKRHKTKAENIEPSPISEKRIIRAVKRFEKILLESRQNQMAEYYEFSINPRRIIFVNMVIGMSRGVGFVLGVSVVGTMVLGLLTWILSGILDIPVIGKFVAEIIESAKSYLQNNQP